jgi:hypothetical protein
MILTYASQKDYDMMSGAVPDVDPAVFGEMYAFMQSFNKELEESGELVDTRALAAPVHTRRLGLRAGVPVVTDGPYAETQEVLAGYWIVECDGIDRATEIAEKLSQCPNPGGMYADAYADVRPIADSGSDIGL